MALMCTASPTSRFACAAAQRPIAIGWPRSSRGTSAASTRYFEAVGEFRSFNKVLDHLLPTGKLGLSDIWDGLKSAPLLRYVKATYGEFLDHAVTDPRLKAVFAAACGDYGLPPSRASALVGLAVLYGYMDGASFPRGGSGTLRDAIQHVATQGGATFRTSAEVEHIELEGRGACAACA